jgi:hypothetical protein
MPAVPIFILGALVTGLAAWLVPADVTPYGAALIAIIVGVAVIGWVSIETGCIMEGLQVIEANSRLHDKNVAALFQQVMNRLSASEKQISLTRLRMPGEQ